MLWILPLAQCLFIPGINPVLFLTLSDVTGFLLFVNLGLAFCRYLSLQKKDSALSISASNLE